MAVTVHHNKHREAYDFLRTHKVGVLATVSPDCEPYAAAIYFSIDQELNATFLTKTGTKKADNLEHNNHAMLIVYEAETQTTVQIKGSTTKIVDLDEISKVFQTILNASLSESQSSMPPIVKLNEGDYVVYRLQPDEVKMAVFSQAKIGNYKDLFTTIIP